MTQKANLFKGQQKKKSVPPNRHGKPSVTRKGKRFVKPAKVTKEMDVDRTTDVLIPSWQIPYFAWYSEYIGLASSLISSSSRWFLGHATCMVDNMFLACLISLTTS
ncbi:hypothetical protein SO802_008423 [Lithocarpus litseifolius]|uniref:Uncharacterized protein n=1 Tax=Lithocarpus litseifolius TaxID=425828 RepID=A0AAW2DE50_9ROSI